MILKNKIEDILQGIKRILNAFKYSYDGFKAVFKSEPAFRQDLAVFIVLTPVALWLNIAPEKKALLVFSLFFILFAECVNTAIEVTIDRISTDIHPLSKKAKDIGSLMVLLSFINAGITWFLVLF